MLDQHADNALASHELFADEDAMRALFARVRREDPLHWTQAEGYDGFWIVSKYDDVKEVGRQNTAFLNAPLTFLRDIEEDRAVRARGGSYARTLVNLDMPEHRLYRGLTQLWFLPANTKRLNGVIEARAAELVEKMVGLGGRCDFVNDIAIWYPLRVIMDAMGVPQEDHALLLRLTQQLLAPMDPAMRREKSSGAAFSASKAAVIKDFFEYFSKVLENRRAQPTDDLASVVANGKIEGESIGQMEALSYFLILSTAGHDTTANSLSGGLLALLNNPNELSRLRADPTLLDTAVEEIFRWVSPVRHFMRTAATECQLRHKTIRTGDRVMLCYPSANQDEEVFGDPHVFRIDRKPNRHLAFGFGAHACLGRNLAQAELRAFLKVLLARIDEIDIDGACDWVISNQVSGPKSMPIRYTVGS